MKKQYVLLTLFAALSLFTKGQTVVDITNLTGGITTTQYGDSPSAEGLDKLFDNVSTTKFLTFHASTWVQYQAALPYVLSKYTITSGNDAPERDPKNWVLSGSYNGITFYPIDSQENQVFGSRSFKKTYTVTNNTASYAYYRLTMTNNSGTLLQVSELELWGIEGAPFTDVLADFGLPSYYSTVKPIQFTNASLNATSYNWTFEGGVPATSTEASPVVVFNTAGDHQVTLNAINGDKSAAKTIKLTVKDINDWSSFISPVITLECANTANAGYVKYTSLAKLKGYNTIEEFVQSCCLVIAKSLYYTVDEANDHNLRNINYKLTEGGSLSYKGGSPPNIEIGFDMNYLNDFASSHTDKVSADEIYGVLCHELCHGYQNEPKNCGEYKSGDEYFGFIEGTADFCRLQTGGFNPKRYPSKGGSYKEGYNTTAFFYQWIMNARDKDFLKKMNRTAVDIDPWSMDAVTKELLGSSALSLWALYQKAIGTPVETEKANTITILLDPSRTNLTINNLEGNNTISVYDMSGKKVVQQMTDAQIETLDISGLPNGVLFVRIANGLNTFTKKVIK